jgi:hypothetical protein
VTGVHRLAFAGWLVLATGCGRIGFEPSDVVGDGGGGGGVGSDPGGGGPGGGTSPLACADMDLGSALGPAVASGSTVGKGNDYRCRNLGGSSDVALGWTAPAAGAYTIDLCGSDLTWDSSLDIRDGSCTGPELACVDDDDCTLSLHERVTLMLAAQQHIVIIVDGADTGEQGLYQLAITAH